MSVPTVRPTPLRVDHGCPRCGAWVRRFESYADALKLTTYLWLCSRCGHNWAEPTTRRFWDKRWKPKKHAEPGDALDERKRLRRRKAAGSNRVRKAERRLNAAQLEIEDFCRHDDGSALDAAVEELRRRGGF